MNNNKICMQLATFSELMPTPVIISGFLNPQEIIHINKSGVDLVEEIFNSVADFSFQVSSFTGLFKKILQQNKLETVYIHVMKKNKSFEDLFVSFATEKNSLYSIMLKISIFTDDATGRKFIVTVLNNISEIFSYRSELLYSRKYLTGFIDAFARDRITYLLAYEHEETARHLMEVREFSKLIAQRIMTDNNIPNKSILEYSKITPLYIKILEISALLHDYGKIHGDIHPLINLPRKLNPDEYETIKKHTTFGAELIGSSNEILRMCRFVAKYHHEKWDGSGYPEGLRGREIPLSARIVAFADMFSALRDKRAYKKAITDKEEIIKIFYDCEIHFDPVVFNTGINLIPVMLDQTYEIELSYTNLKLTSESFLQLFRGIVGS